MIIYDRDGVIEIEAGAETIEATKEKMTNEQVVAAIAKAHGREVPQLTYADWWSVDQAAMHAADALGIRYWLLDRAG